METTFFVPKPSNHHSPFMETTYFAKMEWWTGSVASGQKKKQQAIISGFDTKTNNNQQQQSEPRAGTRLKSASATGHPNSLGTLPSTLDSKK